MKKIVCFLAVLASLAFSAIYAENTVEADPVLDVSTITVYNNVDNTIEAYERSGEAKKTKEDVETEKRNELAQKLNKIKDIENKKEWFLAYKNIMFEYAEWADPPDSVFYHFTEEEVRLICQVVETECYQQDFESKSNVAGVIFNRFYSGEFGDTITEVVTSANQFAYGRTAITEDTILAVQYSFEVGDATNGALFFHSNEKTDTFCGREYMFTDLAGHHFY